jgi:hypothetical protein
MPLRSTGSVPVSEAGRVEVTAELPTYDEVVALMRRLDESPPDRDGSSMSWLEHCEQRGIFHCLTAEFVTRLAEIVSSLAPRCCVEVGAGDGALARALGSRGVPAVATDPQPRAEGVRPLGAAAAIARHSPDLVIACWPPSGADVEITVLQSPGVRHFIYIAQKINGQIGPHHLWSHPQWQYSLREDLLAYSLSRFDYHSARQHSVVKHSYPFMLSRRSG